MANIYTISSNSNPSFHIHNKYPTNIRKLSALFEFTQKTMEKPVQVEPVAENDNLYSSLKLYWRFGSWIGLLPILGLGEKSSSKLKFSRFSFPVLWNLVITLMIFVNVWVGAWNLFISTKQTASDVATQSAMLIFYSMGLFLYTYFRRNANDFLNLFTKWKQMKKLYFSNESGDKKLQRDAYLIASIIFTSGICENFLLFLLQAKSKHKTSIREATSTIFGKYLDIYFPVILPEVDSNKKFDASIFEFYYNNSHPEWIRIYDGSVPALSKFLGVFLFLSNKFVLYSWNYTDILIVILSRALYKKFEDLNCIAKRRLIIDEDIGINDIKEWKALTEDFSILVNLLHEFIIFLSPLVFASYAVNVYFVCIQIKMGLAATTSDPTINNSLILGIYTVWSFVHLIFRVFAVSLSGARINEHINDTCTIIQYCPSESYILEVQRADHRISSTQIGLTGLGCFIITKPFLLTIVGVVFTLEIVLLQPI